MDLLLGEMCHFYLGSRAAGHGLLVHSLLVHGLTPPLPLWTLVTQTIIHAHT